MSAAAEAPSAPPAAAELPPSGVIRRDALDALLGGGLYATHRSADDAFLARHKQNLEGYGKLWGRQPMGLWSRRFEYPYTASRVAEHARTSGRTDLQILDAGSGVTYLPYLITSDLPGSRVTCVDYDPTYQAMFDAVNATEYGDSSEPAVSFVEASLQDVPVASDSFDVVTCVSVLEHTDEHQTILAEFDRVLRPGGSLVLTFDLSLDEKFQLRRDQAQALLFEIMGRFDPDHDLGKGLATALDGDRDALLTTDHVYATDPSLLPWTHPWPVRAAYDLVKGRGWTGGFRSKAVYCLTATSKK